MTHNRDVHSRANQSGRHTLRAAVLDAFAADRTDVAATLVGFDQKSWRAELEWLDVSGLALYLLDHLRATGQEAVLPLFVLARLRQNLADNTERTQALLAEAVGINQGFESDGVRCVNLKGITLYPHSVHDPVLRCQLDLDFLIAEADAEKARGVLEGSGYELHCKSGNTWEFKTTSSELAKLKDFYKVKPQRSAELHLATKHDLLARAERRSFFGAELLALSAVDQYLAQAQHLFKHLCSPHTRAGWVLEARRHMVARREDAGFWKEVEGQLSGEPSAALPLALVSLLIRQVFDEDLPQYLHELIQAVVTPAMRVWVTHYGRRSLLSDAQGTKFYLLLLEVLPSAQAARGQLRRHLFPLGLPAMITHACANEALSGRLKRYRVQASFVLYRLRFHGIEGARYFLESFRFRRLLMEVGQ